LSDGIVNNVSARFDGHSAPRKPLIDWENTMTCTHSPACPDAASADCCHAHTVADHSEQGWCRLCNGVILFDDGLYLAPDGHVEPVPLSA
jgi:hypothetical protein